MFVFVPSCLDLFFFFHVEKIQEKRGHIIDLKQPLLKLTCLSNNEECGSHFLTARYFVRQVTRQDIKLNITVLKIRDLAAFPSKQKEIQKPVLGFLSPNLPHVQYRCLQQSQTSRRFSVDGHFQGMIHLIAVQMSKIGQMNCVT